MAKYAVNQEGISALSQLANNLLIYANEVVEHNQKLEQLTLSLGERLGIYEEEIITIIHNNRRVLNVNRDDILVLANCVKNSANELAMILGLGIGDGLGYESTFDNSKIEKSAAACAIANVMPGEPMSFKEADSGHVNPNYGNDEGYSINCQSCVVVFEARQRGYDVQVLPNRPGSMLDRMSRDTNLAWIDPVTGKHPEYIYDNSKRTPEEYLDFIDSVIEQGERYTLEFGWAGRGNGGHIVNIDRDPKGLLRIKDNQRGLGEQDEWIDDVAVLDYLCDLKYEEHTLFSTIPCVPKLLRVDNMDFDYSVVEQIMKGY